MSHVCKRCGYETSNKSNLLKHLRRVNPCEAMDEDIERSECIRQLLAKEYKEETYDCATCEKKFNTYQSRWRHSKVCKKNEETKNEIQLLKDEIKDLRVKMTVQITNNTQINIQNNINVRDFGQENITHLPVDFISWCFANKDLVKLIENIHCDKDHPENHNIRIKSQKRKQIETREHDRWTIKDEDDALTECIENGYRILVRHAWKHKDQIIENELDDENEYNTIREWLEAVYNNNQNEQKPIKRKLLVV
jgi:hypothetical protein